jgi:hypothetical protein
LAKIKIDLARNPILKAFIRHLIYYRLDLRAA